MKSTHTFHVFKIVQTIRPFKIVSLDYNSDRFTVEPNNKSAIVYRVYYIDINGVVKVITLPAIIGVKSWVHDYINATIKSNGLQVKHVSDYTNNASLGYQIIILKWGDKHEWFIILSFMVFKNMYTQIQQR